MNYEMPGVPEAVLFAIRVAAVWAALVWYDRCTTRYIEKALPGRPTPPLFIRMTLLGAVIFVWWCILFAWQ